MAKAVLSEKGGSIALTLFGVPFFLIGVTILYFMLVSPLLTLKDSNSWPEVNAEILDLKFSVDANTQKVKEHFFIEYSYQYEGVSYKSTGLFLDIDSPNPQMAKEVYPALKKAFDSDAKISVFINPNFPAQSAIYKELKDDLIMMGIFGSVFGVLALAVIFGGILMYRSVSAKEIRKKENPAEEWMWDKNWSQGISKPERKSNLITGFVFLCFWFGMTGISALALADELLDGGVMSYFVACMLLLGLLFVYFYIKAIFRYRKYGQSYLELITLPGRLGQKFKAEVYAPFFLRPEGEIHFKVDCKRHYSEGHGDSRRSKTELLYEDRFTVDPDDARSLQKAFIIPVSFSLPQDKPESSDSIFWTLSSYASTVGLDWSETYKIPVFK